MIISAFFSQEKQTQKPCYHAKKWAFKKVRFLEWIWLTITKLNV